MNLSETISNLTTANVVDSKNINQQLINNVQSLGGSAGELRNVSLQFNIWKKCIEQRQQDEMLFSLVFSILPLTLVLSIDLFRGNSISTMIEVFGVQFYDQEEIFDQATQGQLENFCPTIMSQMI